MPHAHPAVEAEFPRFAEHFASAYQLPTHHPSNRCNPTFEHPLSRGLAQFLLDRQNLLHQGLGRWREAAWLQVDEPIAKLQPR